MPVLIYNTAVLYPNLSSGSGKHLLLSVRNSERDVDRMVADALDVDQHIQEHGARFGVAFAGIHAGDMRHLIIILALVHTVLYLDDALDQFGRGALRVEHRERQFHQGATLITDIAHLTESGIGKLQIIIEDRAGIFHDILGMVADTLEILYRGVHRGNDLTVVIFDVEAVDLDDIVGDSF